MGVRQLNNQSVHNGNVVSLAEYQYRNFDFGYNLRVSETHAKGIRQQMVKGYMELLSKQIK